MDLSSEQNARRILAVGVLFATVGILALVITLMQPSVQDERERMAKDIFDTKEELEAKHQVLASLSASTTQAETTEQQKLRVLESLSAH